MLIDSASGVCFEVWLSSLMITFGAVTLEIVLIAADKAVLLLLYSILVVVAVGFNASLFV